MKHETVVGDERPIIVENASYRWGFMLLAFGILLLAAYRASAMHEKTLDLISLVVLGRIFTAAYQGIRRVLSRRWLLTTIATVIIAAIIAATITLLR